MLSLSATVTGKEELTGSNNHTNSLIGKKRKETIMIFMVLFKEWVPGKERGIFACAALCIVRARLSGFPIQCSQTTNLVGTDTAMMNTRERYLE